MEIVSWQFALFVAVVLVIYYCLSMPAQKLWLVLSSYVFYLTWGAQFALLLFGLTVANFFIAQRVWALEQKRDQWFQLGLWINVGALLFFKFFDSAYGDKTLVGLGFNTHILLPLGLAFYTLQAISYQVDVAKRLIPATDRFIDFALYMAYFPKLLAGPIERARVFLPQLTRPRVVTNQSIERGLALILLGLTRKFVIAELLMRSIKLTEVWHEPYADHKTLELLLWLLMYAFVLYNDFAGYTDIVRGISELFGIRLSPNFRQPFFAHSFSDFWNRWHISFSSWLRDYIYYPLRRRLLRWYPDSSHIVNLALPYLVTMIIGGLWHHLGAALFAWGGLHGLYQIGGQLFGLWLPTKPVLRWQRFVSALGVFALTTFAWVPFKLELLVTAQGALAFWQSLFITNSGAFIFSPKGFADLMAPLDPWWVLLFLPMALSLLIDFWQYRADDDLVFLQWSPLAQGVTIALAIGLLALAFQLSVTSVFVYQVF